MAIFNGKYKWDGVKKGAQSPISWSAGTYNVKIFKYHSISGKVEHLKQFVCIYSATGEGQSISANPERFAKQICADFSLDLERVLWVEDHLRGADRYEVILFSRAWQMGEDVFYKIDKRPALQSELELIRKQLSGAKNGD